MQAARDTPTGQCVLLDNQGEHLADRMLRCEGSGQYLQPMLPGTGGGAGHVRRLLRVPLRPAAALEPGTSPFGSIAVAAFPMFYGGDSHNSAAP